MDFGLDLEAQTRRLPIYLLIDTSDSMAGEPIQLAKEKINSLHRELMETPEVIDRVWLSVITFGATTKQIIPLTHLIDFVLPELNPEGAAKLGMAFGILKDALGREIIPNQPGQKGDYKALVFLFLGSEPVDQWQSQVDDLYLKQISINSLVAVFCRETINVNLEQIPTTQIENFFSRQIVTKIIEVFQLPSPKVNLKQEAVEIKRSGMKEVPASMTQRPFGKINYEDDLSKNKRIVRATILTDFIVEQAKFGLAIDGSLSMQTQFESGKIKHIVEKIGKFLAERDRNGTTSLIYWATGEDDDKSDKSTILTEKTLPVGIENLGEFSFSKPIELPKPQKYGNKSLLSPALKYFIDSNHILKIDKPRNPRFVNFWYIFVFLINGIIEDFEEVKNYSRQLAQNLSKGEGDDRPENIKLLLVGLNDGVDKKQLKDLDDLITGTNLDLWDTKLLPEIRDLDHPYELFAELGADLEEQKKKKSDISSVLVSKDGFIRDSKGKIVEDYRNSGLPTILQFSLPYGETLFSLEIAGKTVDQYLPFAGLLEPGPVNISPLDIDFGHVKNFLEKHSRTISIINNTVDVWKGEVDIQVPWLEIDHQQLECLPGERINLHVSLKSRAQTHLRKLSNVGLIIIKGNNGYERPIRVTVATVPHIDVFDDKPVTVLETWKYIAENHKRLSEVELKNSFKNLIQDFCNKVGLHQSIDIPRKESYKFFHFELDVSSAFIDTNFSKQALLVCTLQSELTNNDQAILDKLASDFCQDDAIMFLILFVNNSTKVQKVRSSLLTTNRSYHIVVLGFFELRSILTGSPNNRRVLRRHVIKNIDLTILNPFKDSAPADNRTFSGRERELAVITRKSHEQSFAVVGGRRIGKTSLLHQLHFYRRLSRGNFRTLHYDCGLLPDNFWAAKPDYWQPESPLPTPDTFHDLFASPPDDKSLVIMMDEIDKLIVRERQQNWPVFNKMRALINSKRIQFVLFGAHELQNALRDANSPLFNMVQILSLRRLEKSDVEQLITRPISQLEIKLKPERKILDLIWQHTDGHPAVVQGLCHRLLEGLSKPQMRGKTVSTRVIVPDNVTVITQDIDFLEKVYLDTYWAQATYLERIITLVLVKTDIRPYSIEEIRDLLQREGVDVKLRQVEAALNRLVELRCILKKDISGFDFDAKSFTRILPRLYNTRYLLESHKEGFQEYGDVVLQYPDGG